MAQGGPKPAFYVAVGLVVLGLVALGLWRFGEVPEQVRDAARITQEELQELAGGAEAPDTGGITTVKEYDYVAASKLPDVKGVSNYSPLKQRTVRFAMNVWAGWAPIIYANEGFQPRKVWETPGGQPFKLEPVYGRQKSQQLQARSDEVMRRVAVLVDEELRGVYTDSVREIESTV